MSWRVPFLRELAEYLMQVESEGRMAAHARWTACGRDSVAVFDVPDGTYQSNGVPAFHVPVTSPQDQRNREHALVRYPEARSQSAKLEKN